VPAPTDAVDEPVAADPASPAEWAAVVGDLYARRATAFTTGSAAVLDEVYEPDSALLAADRRSVADLAAAGELLRGFAPEVVRVESVTVTDDGVELELVDRWPDYEVVAADGRDDGAVRWSPGRPDAPVRMVLARAGDGWRIETAGRTG
jgi:hypothetical protein